MSNTTGSGSFLIIDGTWTEMSTSTEDSDVWQSLTLANNSVSETESMTVQVTLCMTAFTAREMKIPASRQTSFPPEPTLSWEVNEATWAADDVLRQLDTSRSTEERGIFDLDIWSYDLNVGWVEETTENYRVSSDYSTVEAVAQVKDHIYDGMVNKAQYTVFSQMAASTGNPALALQAYFTTLCATAYYDRIITFDKAAPSTRTSLNQVTRPLGWAGYILVLSVLVAHLLLVLLVIILFLRDGKMSLIGNAWAAVSQLLGPETEEWIKEVDRLDDKMVKSWLKARGKHSILVHLKEMNGRVVIVNKNKGI
jgi:hypothetical protein